MEYNSERERLIIPEYGRNVQNMVNHAVATEDREERNKIANAIIKVMGALFPYLRDVEDFNHKLWDHLFIMSDFKLDVDSPYPKPTPENFSGKPQQLNYPDNNFRYGHYGRYIEDFIKEIIKIEDTEERSKASLQIANLMKRMYTTYNRDTVSDEIIIKQLAELSNNAIVLPTDTELAHVNNGGGNRSNNNQPHKKRKHHGHNKSNHKKRH